MLVEVSVSEESKSEKKIEIEESEQSIEECKLLQLPILAPSTNSSRRSNRLNQSSANPFTQRSMMTTRTMTAETQTSDDNNLDFGTKSSIALNGAIESKMMIDEAHLQIESTRSTPSTQISQPPSKPQGPSQAEYD